jgi:peptidoglycan/xylan/chitin deacetylase (PgdA/CDA1 family)
LIGCSSAPVDEPIDPCAWTTSTGRASCGARPPAHRVAPQRIERWVVQNSAFVETGGDGAMRELAWDVPPTDFRDHFIHLALETEHIANASAFELLLGDGASYFRFNLRSTQGQQYLRDGEHDALTISWSGASVVGTPSRERITHVALRVVDNGAPVRIAFDGVALVREPIDRYPRGVLSFTFDDNWSDMITEAAPLLDRNGFAATAYVIVQYVGMPGRASLFELQERHARGWDIAAHSYAIHTHELRWPELDPIALEDDIVDSRAWIIEHGFTGADHCAYPGGTFTGTHAIAALVDRYFASCRTIYQRNREGFLPASAQRLRVFYVTSGTTLAAAKAAVDDAAANREWIILVFHKLVDAPKLSTEWAKTDFAQLVEHVASTAIPVETVTRVLEP